MHEDYGTFLVPIVSLNVANAIEALFAKDCGHTSIEAEMDRFNRSYYLHANGGGTLGLKADRINRIFIIETVKFKQERQGYGTQLVHLIEKWAKDSGCRAVLLESVNSEAGYRHAVKMGYKYYDERAEYVPEVAAQINEIQGFVPCYSHIKWL